MNKKKIILGIAIGLCLVLAMVGTGVLGKYIANEEGTSYIDATDFIYECNLENEQTYYINPSSTPDSINCIVVNYIGSKISEDDITGTVKLTKSGVQVGETHNFNLTKNVKTKLEIEMAVLSLIPGEEYTMEVKTTSPYSKTITSTFIVNDYSSISSYSIVDNGGWVEVEIKIGAVLPTSGITINYSELAPDNTNPLMSDWVSNSSNVISNSELETNSVITLIFIKETSKTYTNVSDIVLVDEITIN